MDKLQDLSTQLKFEGHLKLAPLHYPDERVVGFLSSRFSNKSENLKKRALDVGFGSGRHLQLLLDFHFQTYGIDYNYIAKETALSSIGAHPMLMELRTCDMHHPPFSHDYFDLILCWGTSFNRPYTQMQEDLAQIYKMLKPKGELLINFRSKDNWFYKQGFAVDQNTYYLDEKAGPYAGMCYTFLDLNEAKELLTNVGFEIQNFEFYSLHKHQLQEFHSWWSFWLCKT